MFEIEIKGFDEAIRAIDGIVAARSSVSVRRNFQTVLGFIKDQIKQRTPGKGTLRAAWQYRTNVLTSRDGWTINGKISNAMSRRDVHYRTAISQTDKIKLKADDTPLKWGEVIKMLDRGTKAHRIYPRRYPFLVFRVPRARRNVKSGRFQRAYEIIYSKGVRHPGTKAYKLLSEPARLLERLARNNAMAIQNESVSIWRSGRKTFGQRNPLDLGSGRIY